MEASTESKPETTGTSALQEAIGRRAREIYEKSGKIPGRDLENWIQAEAEILKEQTEEPSKSAVVVRVNGVQYVGEYQVASSDGYIPGEFAKGDLVPVRFDGDQMFVRRPNGKELTTRIVSQLG